MKKILVISGSNSANSINKKLAISVANKLKKVDFTILDLSTYKIPMYSTDLEKSEGIPNGVEELFKVFNNHDGFIISIPEYNSSLPGFFKNIIDWLSRVHMSFFDQKPILLMSTSPGPGGGKSVISHAEKIMSGYMGGKIVGKFSLPKFYKNFIQSSNLGPGELESNYKKKA